MASTNELIAKLGALPSATKTPMAPYGGKLRSKVTKSEARTAELLLRADMIGELIESFELGPDRTAGLWRGGDDFARTWLGKGPKTAKDRELIRRIVGRRVEIVDLMNADAVVTGSCHPTTQLNCAVASLALAHRALARATSILGEATKAADKAVSEAQTAVAVATEETKTEATEKLATAKGKASKVAKNKAKAAKVAAEVSAELAVAAGG